MTFPVLNPPRVLLHVIIPGCVRQQRARAGGVVFSKKFKRYVPRFYDPSADDKTAFRWQLRAACPTLIPDLTAHIGVRIIAWTSDVNIDWDNIAKFYCDAMSTVKVPKKARKFMDPTKQFAVWGNDRQVEECYVRLHRGAIEEKVEILVYELVHTDGTV